MQHPERPGISIYDAGQHNKTIGDGLAVPIASTLVYPLMRDRLSGIVLVSDERMCSDVWRLHSCAGLKVEPSAAAAVSGPRELLSTQEGARYLKEHCLSDFLHQANHVVWTTGGALMPTEEHEELLVIGEQADRKFRAEASPCA